MADKTLTPLQQAALALRRMRARVDTLEQAARAPVAVVGLACRYPGGAVDGEHLWRNLVNGVDATSEIPDERWDVDAHYDPRPGVPGKMYTRRGGFIDRVDEFDAQFFRIAPRDAIGIDPQQRLLLQTVWHALEDAGLPPPSLQGRKVGVFLGISTNDYSNLLSKTAFGSSSNAGAGAGNAASVASGRISYTFDFQGPCVAIDTACSSSLVATHLAVQALRAGECEIAVVAGVNLMLAPDITVNFCQARMLSPDGRCKTFDAGADGYARAEGCGVVVLKRLADAGADHVRALIAGSAINQDGRSAGLTAPSGPAQEAVIRAAIANAGLTPAEVDAIEAHGTGTGLGDPIEMHALAAVFRERDRPLWVGSIKSNMGHAEAAAGVGGLIKAVLMAERGQIAPSLHFDTLNPHIDVQGADIRVPVRAQPTPPRAVGVSSFGFSGTNAHIVVTPPPPICTNEPERPAGHVPRLLISARTPAALAELVASYCELLAADPASFPDVCHSAATGRARLPWWVCVERPQDLASAEPQHGRHPEIGPQPGRRVKLPAYPFERQRYWIDTSPAPAAVAATTLPEGAHPLLGRPVHLPFSDERRFETALHAADPGLPWLAEHRVHGQAVLPAAALLELLHAAAPGQEIQDLDLLLPVQLPEQPGLHLHTILAADGTCRIVSWNALDPSAPPRLHARARLVAPGEPPALPEGEAGASLPLAGFFAEMERRGIGYGPAFRGLRELHRTGEGQVAASVALPEEAGSAGAFTLHPALLDAALQAVAGALPADDASGTLVPARFTRARLLRRPKSALRVQASARRNGAHVLADLRVDDATGLVAFCAGLEFRPITAAMLADAGNAIAADAFYTIEPEPCPLVDGLSPPDFLPEPADLCRELAPVSAATGERLGIGVYAETAPALDRITAAFVQRALLDLGLEWQPGRLLTPNALAAELEVADRHRRLFRRLLAILAGAGMLEPMGPAFRILPGSPAADPVPELDALIAAHPGAAAELGLVRRAGPRLADVLAERVDPLTLLFPSEGGGAADLYGSSAYARTVNTLLGEAITGLRDRLPQGRLLRILEIGAGTGGATGALLEALPEGIARYAFTDLSPVFLDAAKARFHRADLAFARLDIEQDPQPQGFGEASQDLVVAANVIHATRDLRESLAHIHGLLAPGGLLVLVETTEPRPWVDIVFGLTEGWWRFADRELRPEHPLLGRERWLEVLAQAGFVADALPAGEIILARKPLAETAAPRVRVLGDRSGVALADSVGAAQALYVAPAAAATMAGQLDLFDELLATIRRLIAEPTPPSLTILSDGSLGHAGLAGFLRTLRLEQPKLRVRLLEAPPTERALLDELAAPDGESHVLWRDGRRQAPRLRPARLPEPAGHVSGSWIVTGGSGDVGRVAAARLAGHGASRIVLVSRTRPAPMPDVAVRVDLYAADAADEAAMAAIVAGLPDLGGIVHAAGLLDDAPVGGQNRARFAAVMRGKVEAALVLDRLTRSRPDVRLVLFASAAGVLGSAEQANHAAASSFLDALARERAAAGLPTVSIDWGIWREIGAAARLGVVERAEKLGLGSISPAQGRAAFAAALADGVPAQLAVLPGVDWQRFLGQFPADETPDLLQGLTSSRAAAGDVPARQPQDEAGPAERLSRIVADVVGLPHPADPDTPLPDFGLDSLMAVEIRNRVQRELGIELGVRELLEGIDIRTIAARAGDPADAAPMRRIEPDLAARHEPFPLTEIQQAYWIGRGDTLELGNVGCYLYTEVELRDVDLPRLERAWNMLVRRHDMLRAIVLADGRQQILAEVPDYRIEEHGLDGQDEAVQLLAIRERLSHRLPDPAVWPLFDIRVTRHAGGRRLHIGLDLLVLDAASIFQLREEWGRLYEDPATALPPIGLSFRDFVLEGLAWRQSPAWQESARYWQERLPTLPGGPDLPLARQPGQIDRPRFVRRMATLPAELWSRLQSAGQAQGLTPSALLAAAYADILASWSRSARFCLNLTSFNRPPLHPDMPALIGDFTSTILLEVDATPAAFAERAVALQKRLAQDLDHAEVGGVHVLRELARTRGVAAASIPVVFTSALGFRAPDGAKSSWDRISDMVHSVAQTPQVWIDHQASEHEGGLLLTWDVVEDLFPPGVVDRMFAAYRRLLDSLASGEGWSGAVGASVDLPPRPAPQVAFTPEPLFAGLLRQPEQMPDRPALIDASGQTSFAELARLSALAAGRLLALGAGPEKVVAVDLPKSRQQALAALAVLRSGAAYLPLDPALPPARRAELIADTAAIVPDWPDLLDGQGEPAALPAVDPASLAYVIFTSGSTGKPKGVMVEHGAALNTVLDLNRRWRVGPADRVLGLSALNFDLSVYDLFGVPAAGGALVLPGEDQRRDPAAWAELVRRHRVTIWNTVPALAAMLAEHGLDPDHPLRLFLLSGDWIPLELVPKLRALAPDAELVSLGGATEAAIWSIFHPIGEPDPAWASVPYGQPLSNQTMHVVDAHGRPCPDWVVGEIEIGGIGLARGYWGDPARTAERFRRDPLTGERRYRTGDLGRFRPDHLIEFLGREDFQVKVGGHRIELGEIEAHLVQHPAVRQAVAAALPVPGQPRQKTLHAFVVAKDGVADADLWPDAVQVAGEAVAATAAPIEPDLFQAAADRLARFTAGAAAAALERLGGFSGGLPVDADGLPDIDALMARCGIVPGYRRWLARTLELIRRFGRDAAADDPLRDFAAFDRFGFGAQDLDLLRRLTSELPDILCGKKHAGDIYLDAGTLDVYAKLFQAPYQVLGRTIRRLAELRRVNVLEVGAGLGTTLVGLQPHLPLDRITYHFTDVSPHFIHMAERRLGTPPWLRLSRLDLMAPVEAAAELHDVVIASSVLHAVPDVETALASIRQRLRPGGILVILEETRFQPWYDMSMGLQSGFDSFSDRYRVRHPLLGREAWRDVLAEAGFGRVEIPAAPGSLGDQLGLDVILASLPALDGPASAGPVDEFGPELRRFLAERLPDYMVPRFVHRLARLPLTANGKVDRSALGTVAVHEEGTASPDEQPASPAEQRIATLIGEVLDCAPPPPGRSFFDLGADSLKLVMVQRRLRETTGRSLDMTALFADPTVRGIAAALDLPAEAEPARKLVMFNKPSGRPILFTVPGVVALPYYLRELARELEPVATLAGLQLPGFFGGEAPLDRIEAQAAHLVAAMRAQQPRGPYLLLGHSYGGTVAFEAARQLRFQGEEIGFLGVLDTVVTESSLDDFQNDQVAQGSIVRALYALYGDRLPVPLEEVRALPPDEQLARTMQALGQGGLVDLSVAVDGVLEVFKANFRAMVAYTPGRYDGPFTLYRTEGGFPEEYYEYESGKALDDPALGWSGFLDGRLEIEDLPGDHLSLLDAAHLPNLAARLKRRIEAAMAVEAR